MNLFCDMKGIKREFIVARTPQQKGGLLKEEQNTREECKNYPGTKDNIVAGQAEKKKEPEQEYILIPICTNDPLISQGPKDSAVDAGKKATETEQINSTNSTNTASTPVSTVGPSFANAAPSSPINAAGTPISTANAFEEHLFE
ncbi:hypothetical protein Tco_0000018 [Tanacetum coccineum]